MYLLIKNIYAYDIIGTMDTTVKTNKSPPSWSFHSSEMIPAIKKKKRNMGDKERVMEGSNVCHGKK